MRWMVLLALASCWTGRSSVAPAVDQTVATIAYSVPTCAVEPRRIAQQLVLRRWLGRIGERSWLVAETDDALMLVGLAGERLSLTPLPFGTLRASYVSGTRLWLAGAADARTALVEIELGGAAPQVAPALIWDHAPLAIVDALAVTDDRVLLGERDPVDHRFQLFDRGGRRLGPLVTVRSGEPTPPELRCTGERCFAIGIEGDGRTRRAYALRFLPDGATENELLASDRIASLQVATFGDRAIAVWTSLERVGLFGRALDGTGRPVGGRVAFDGLPAAPLVFELLPASPPRIAVRDIYDGWSLGSLDIDARIVDHVRALPFTTGTTAFAGAVTLDGMTGAGYSNRPDHRVGARGFVASATAVFVPPFGDAEPPLEIVRDVTGEGRAGIAALPLVAPGHAAVLVVPRVEPEHPGELVLLRRPCEARQRQSGLGTGTN
jgi:hypothetical protein